MSANNTPPVSPRLINSSTLPKHSPTQIPLNLPRPQNSPKSVRGNQIARRLFDYSLTDDRIEDTLEEDGRSSIPVSNSFTGRVLSQCTRNSENPLHFKNRSISSKSLKMSARSDDSIASTDSNLSSNKASPYSSPLISPRGTTVRTISLKRNFEPQSYAEEQYENFKRDYGENEPITMAALVIYAKALLNAKKYSTAIPLYEKVLQYCRFENGTLSIETLGYLEDLADAYYHSEKYDMARNCFYQAKLERENLVSDFQTKEYCYITRMLADSQMKSNYTNDAVETYKYLIPIEERIYGQNHQETLCLKCELGKLFLIKKDFKEAESLFKVIHSTCITLFGKDHPQTNSINAQLAKLHLITKQYQKSIDIYQNCIHITILHNGEKSEITLQYMYELALVYAEMGLTSEAIKYLDRCILLGSDLYGQNHPTICEWIDYRSKKLIKKKWLFF